MQDVCKICYNWVCRKLAKENAKKVCENPKDEHVRRICQERTKSGKWLTPAFVKKKQKKSKHKSKKDNGVNSKKVPQLKLRSMRRGQMSPTTKQDKMFFPLEPFKQDLSHQPNIEYSIT